ncbi:MAG: dihydrofolate reductase [Pseudomonadota bacterium]
MQNKPLVAIAVAVAENNIIGADNDMPWHLSSDLKRFKAITLGKPIIMGRKTHESIGKVLPGRLNIVISRDKELAIDGAIVVSSLEEAIEAATREVTSGETANGEVMVIGGGTIYEQALPLAARLYVTHVAVSPEGDTRFPPIDSEVWRVVHEEQIDRSEKDSADTLYRIYERH